MKRCPECRRDYTDDSFLYCLDDGSALLEGPASGENMQTAIMGSGERSPLPMEAITELMAGVKRAVEPPAASVAVLPFAHLSSDPDDEYFCDGLAEELINALAKVDGLKVVARTSAFSFKGKNVPINEIGSMLNVQHIVEGSVRKFGERMRITVQFVNAADGYHLWSDKFDTEMRDLFDVQDEITLSVVTALKSKLLGSPARDDVMSSLIEDLKHHAHDVLAYQLYLRGRYFLNKFTTEDFYRAIDCFNQAIGIDENFAAAYAGLADSHLLLTEFGPVPSLDGLPRAKEAALKAIALDPSLAEAHVSLALVLQEFDFDFAGAEAEYLKALELNPNNAMAHQYYGALLAQMGRHDEAEASCLKAIELDPLSPVGTWVYPFTLYLGRRFDDALEQARRIQELDRNFSATYLILSVLHQMRGEYADCVAAYVRFLELCAMPEIAAEGRQAFEAGGWKGFLRKMTSDEMRTPLSSYMAAANFAALGDNEAALASLEASLARREGFIVMLKTDPRFDALRDDPRFPALLRRIGFPDTGG